MECRICKVDKLSKEFPSFHLSKDCCHVRLVCLRTTPIETSSQTITTDEDPILTIIMLTGDRFTIDYEETMTVTDLQMKISDKLDVKHTEQKILHGDIELEEPDKRLLHYGVQPNASLHLLIRLYTIPSHVCGVTFDLKWEFGEDPGKDTVNLDACCFIFQGDKLINVIYYEQTEREGKRENIELNFFKKMFKWTGLITTTRKTKAIEHIGQNYLENSAGQTIKVYLEHIEDEVTHIFFTLSARDRDCIGDYTNPSLSFFETSIPYINLCSTSFEHATNDKAVVICSMERSDKQWCIYKSGKTSAGCANELDPLVETIKKLILGDGEEKME